MPGGQRRGDQVRSRIGYRWSPCVRDQSDVAALKGLQQTLPALALVVLVVADERGRDAKVREQPPTMTRVFGGDQLNLSQDTQCARREILEIPDWRCHDEERAHDQGSLR